MIVKYPVSPKYLELCVCFFFVMPSYTTPDVFVELRKPTANTRQAKAACTISCVQRGKQ